MRNFISLMYLLFGNPIGLIIVALFVIGMLLPEGGFQNFLAMIIAILVLGGLVALLIKFIVDFINLMNGKL